MIETTPSDTAIAPGVTVAATSGSTIGKNKEGKYDSSIFVPIEFDPELHGVGVGSIDNQHRALIGVLAQLCQLGKLINDPPAAAAAAAGAKKGLPSSGAAAAGAGSGSTVGKEFSSPLGSPKGGNVVSHMTVAGAMMMDLKKYQGDDNDINDDNNDNDAQAADESDKKLSSMAKASDRRKSGVAFGTSVSESNSLASSGALNSHNVIYPVRVAPSECSKYVDRGMPPELQLGGAVEPLIEALVFHCNVRLIQEEHNLEAVSFSDRGSHAQEHQIFVREAFRAQHLVESSNFELADLVKLIQFLKMWCAQHISKDRRFAPLMLEKIASKG